MYKNLEQKENKKKEEAWRDIKGYEGRYQVSDMGRVKSLERTSINKIGHKQHTKERIMSPRIDGSGYLMIELCNGRGKGKNLKVHRLVCEAFHKNPKNKPQVNHINEDKLDNRACNLEWVTAKENCNHGTRLARMAKAKSKPLAQYTQKGELVNVWQSTIEVERTLGFNKSHINEVAQGKRKTAYGYIWKYIDEEK